MKNQVDTLDATPHKRLVLSIVADYDLLRSLCELIDNAIDIWIKAQKLSPLQIDIDIDLTQKTISILDNAGGVREHELQFLISPGATSNRTEDLTIGIFGVGTKRAVIALSQDIKITSRYKRAKTFRVEFDEAWLKDDSWYLPYYEVDKINPGSTLIELQRLRIDPSPADLKQLEIDLSEIYAHFLKEKSVTINLNGIALQPLIRENWAYPAKYKPRRFSGILNTGNDKTVRVTAVAGLTTESSPAAGNYGVYFYCNNRLIVGGLKSPEVGFIKGIAGLPHPSLSIMRVVVFLEGSAIDMPWNSSKSNININHPTFLAMRNWLLEIVKNISSLSRRLEGRWPEAVFKYPTGKFLDVSMPDFTPRRSYLIDLPPGQVRYLDGTKQKNSTVETKKPWTSGIVDAVIAVELISKQKLSTKNRIILTLLDSALEISFKEYLVNDVPSHYYNDVELARIFKARHLVIDEIRKYITDVNDEDWKKVKYYNNLRNKLVHERATVDITITQMEDFRSLTIRILKKLFGLKF